MHYVILGNGIAGVTAARELRKRSSDARITLVSGESDHHFSRPALMYVYMGHMRYADIKPYEDQFWTRNRLELKRGWVREIDVDHKALVFEDGERLGFDKLLLAVGSVSNKFGWPGQDLDRVHGMVSLQDLIALERNTRDIDTGVVVGGGLIGIELTEMLHSRGRKVSLLVRETWYWDNALPLEEARLISKHIQHHGIDLRLQTELKEIHDDGAGAVGGVTTSTGDRISCEFVGLTAGVRPNLSLVEDSAVHTERGIVVDDYLQTNVDDIYAAGDCAHVHPKHGDPYLQQVWYTGRAQGLVAARNMLGDEVPYDKGIWFNSAKFLDLEYQVYGTVSNRPEAGVTHLYWEDPELEKSVRICHREGTFIGLQTLGIRYDHRVCEQWIRERATVSQVKASLQEANFDPEFFPAHEPRIRSGLQEVAV